MALEDYAYDGVSARDVLDINNETILTKLAREALPPLAWLGETLDKPGRAVRGLLAGQPGELLNLIPFSDTLGITDPANTVTGRDLLRKAGIAGQEDTWGNWLGGLGLEIALDPLNFVTLGTKSSLSALGRDALREGGTGLAKTAAERIAAKQSGLMGLRTPWYTDIMGLPSGNMLLGTGAKAEYLAGQGLTDARNFIDKFAAGRAVTGAFDKANAIRQTLFTPGAGYSMDPRITGTSAQVANETEDAVRAATLAQRMEITDQARVAHEYLASHGVPPQVAEDAIGRAVTFRAEVADPRYYQPKDVLKEFLHSDEGVRYADALAAKAPTGYGAAGQVAESLHKTSNEIIRGFDDLVKPIAENRTIFDQLYDLQTQAGVKINEFGSDYGNQYVARQSQASGGARKPQTKARTLPQNVLPGAGVQLDDLVNDKRIAGIATAPIPDGVSRQLHMKNVKNTIKQVADEIEQNAIKARNLKYGEPVPTPMQAQPATVSVTPEPGAGTVYEVPNGTPLREVLNKSVRAKQASGAIEHMADAPKFSADDFLEAIKGKPLTSPDTIKALAEHMPHLSDEASTGLLTQLYTELELAGPKRLRKIADAIGAKGADPILGESASDNIIMKLMEAKQPTAAPVVPVTAPTVKPAEVVKPSLDIPEPQYPKDLTDAAIKRDSNKLAKFLAKLPQEQVEQGRGFYRNDVIGGMTQYTDNAATMAGRGKAALTVLAEQVVPEKVVKQNPGNYVNLADALKETGLTGIKKESTVAGDIYHAGGKVTLVDLLSEKGITSLRSNGQPMFAEHVNDVLKNQYVPKDLVEKLAVDIKGPGYMQASGARQFIDDATSTIRSWLTLPWIPFHTRNMLEGFTQQGITGGLGKESVADAAMYLAGAVKDTAKKAELDKLANEAFNLKAAFRHQATEMIGSSVLGKEAKTLKPWVTQGDGTIMGATREWLEGFKPANVAKRGEKYATLNPEKSAIIQQAAKVSQAGDDLQRFSQYIGLRRQGMAPDVAAKMVTDAHLDYTKLTPFERDIARPLIPFYSFSRRSLERMAGQMSNPGPLSSLARAVTSSSEYVPGFVGAGVFPIPGGEDGKQRYMSGFSMPFEDELFSSLVSLASGNLRDAARRGAQTLNPLAKLPITLATNTDLYSGRSLDDMKPTGLAALFPGTSGNVISQMVSATPLGRLANTVNSVASGRDQNILLKMLTGIRTTDVDSELALQDAAKAGLSKVIKRTGMVSASESLYPRQEYRGENEPESLKALLDSMQQLNKRGQDMRRGRAVTP